MSLLKFGSIYKDSYLWAVCLRENSREKSLRLVMLIIFLILLKILLVDSLKKLLSVHEPPRFYLHSVSTARELKTIKNLLERALLREKPTMIAEFDISKRSQADPYTWYINCSFWCTTLHKLHSPWDLVMSSLDYAHMVTHMQNTQKKTSFFTVQNYELNRLNLCSVAFILNG